MDNTRFQNALALRDAGDLENAAREFRGMASTTDDLDERASLLCNLVNCYSQLHQLTAGEGILAEIRSLSPVNPGVRMMVDFLAAGLAAQREKLDTALHTYDRMLLDYADLFAEPDCRDLPEDVQHRRSLILVRLQRYKEAVPLLAESLLFQTLSAGDQQDVHLWLGICYAELQTRSSARHEFLLAIGFGLKNETEAQARYRLGQLCFADGAFAQAKVQFEAILQIPAGEIRDPPREHVLGELSRACRYLGETELAERYARLAQQVDAAPGSGNEAHPPSAAPRPR